MIDITVNQTNNFVVPEEDPIVLAGEPGEYNHNSEELVGFDFWSSLAFVGLQCAFMFIYFAYKFTSLAHPNDTQFGGSLFASVTIYIGMVLSLIGIFYV